MKRTLVITGLVLVILLLAMITLPVIFKSQIIQEIKTTTNQSIDATVDFSEVELSLFKNFPKLAVVIKNLSLTGVGEFDKIRLMEIKEFTAVMNISAIWKSGGLDFTAIMLEQPVFGLVVNKSGKANWEIMRKRTSQPQAGSSDTNTPIELEKVQVHGATFSYTNQSSPMLFAFKNGSFNLSGNMKGNDSKLNFTGNADSILMDYSGSHYISGFAATLKGSVRANFDKMSFEMLDNEFIINNLPLNSKGSFVIGNKDYTIDLAFKSPASSFREIMGFVPAQYQHFLKGVETTGSLTFGGFVQGTYSDKTLPAFGLDLKITGGTLKYPKLPKDVNNIQILAGITKPQGDLDQLIVNLDNFEASIAGNPLKGSLHLATPVSDPSIKGNLNGKIDLSSLKQALPIDSTDMNGIISALIDFDGHYSSIEKLQYENFKTSGNISVKGFEFRSKNLPEKLDITSAEMKISSKEISLGSLVANLGESDFNLSGSLTDFWAYFFNKGDLAGNIKFNSNYININQLIPTKTVKDTTSGGSPIKVPDHVNIVMSANVGKALYDKMKITDVNGKLIIRDQKILLDGLTMNMLSGKLVVSGSYATPGNDKPHFDFKMDIKDFDLPNAYQSLSTVRQFLPVVAQSTGAFNSALSLSGKLDDRYAPIFSTVNGVGMLAAKNVELTGKQLFSEIGKYFRNDLFRQVKVSDFSANFKVINGGLEVAPFTTKVAGQEVTMFGKQSVTKELNYRIDFKVNKDDLSPDVVNLVGLVPGTGNIAKYPIGIDLGGTLDKPDVKVDLTDARKLVETEFKKNAGKALQDAAKKFGLDKLFK